MIKLIYPRFWSKAGLLSYLLLPLSWLYILLGKIRKFFVKPVNLASTVICVGNMSVGGTGKTQIVSHIAKNLVDKNIKLLIVTKGYGSSLEGAKLVEEDDIAAQVGDESVILRDCAPVLAARNIKSALPIINKIKPDVIIFDDGLQNPGFVKDINILAIDANRAIGNGKIFPAGPLRETTQSALDKSDIIIMVGNNDCHNFALMNNIFASNKPFVKAQIKLKQKIDLSKKYYAFTAIGDPDRFYELLKSQGAELVNTQSFPDHHNYTKMEIDNLKNRAKKSNYSLITTKKDYVKICDDDHDIICADVVLDFNNEQKLFNLIYEKLRNKS